MNLSALNVEQLMYQVKNGLVSLSSIPIAQRSVIEHELDMEKEREEAKNAPKPEPPTKRRRRKRRTKKAETE